MKWKYSCPKCTAILNPGPNIILLSCHEGREVLLAFHPEPGNYEVAIPYNVTIKKGERWQFLCPVCHSSLDFPDDENMAMLDMTDGADRWHKVIFSRVAGEQATFIITQSPEQAVVTRHGIDLSKYERCLWHKYT